MREVARSRNLLSGFVTTLKRLFESVVGTLFCLLLYMYICTCVVFCFVVEETLYFQFYLMSFTLCLVCWYRFLIGHPGSSAGSSFTLGGANEVGRSPWVYITVDGQLQSFRLYVYSVSASHTIWFVCTCECVLQKSRN